MTKVMRFAIDAVLRQAPQDLAAFLKATPAAIDARFDKDHFVDAIPHQFYVGDTALHIAAAGVRVQPAKTLLKAGADANAQNRRGATPLHYACDARPHADRWAPREQTQMIKLLIEGGADPDAENKSGVRPLHRAVRSCSPSAVRALLDGGADAKARAGKVGSTPLHIALGPTGASSTAGSFDLRAEIAALLLKHGAAFTDRDARGQKAADRIGQGRLRETLTDHGLL